MMAALLLRAATTPAKIVVIQERQKHRFHQYTFPGIYRIRVPDSLFVSNIALLLM